MPYTFEKVNSFYSVFRLDFTLMHALEILLFLLNHCAILILALRDTRLCIYVRSSNETNDKTET